VYHIIYLVKSTSLSLLNLLQDLRILSKLLNVNRVLITTSFDKKISLEFD